MCALPDRERRVGTDTAFFACGNAVECADPARGETTLAEDDWVGGGRTMVVDQGTASKEEIIARCERFLGGHGPTRPHEELAALAAATAADEEADVYGKGALIEDFEREVAAILG